ncbi:MAG TPA: hypothetical protein DDY68_05370 [Porphyromonadaceae bacterium]|nr:hypothetical protein [Porphyromonadaceae bacterium]
MIYIISLLIMGISWFIQHQLKSRFEEYSKIPTDGGLMGKDVAKQMLEDNGIYDVTITSVEGQLTDHYNPENKTVNLSKDVYYSNSVVAAAVAAHECGHAVQHATGYTFLTLRSKLVPVVSFASQWMQWVLLAGILLVQNFPILLEVGIVLFATTTLFAFVTLPVEINASWRAVTWLNRTGVTNVRTHDKAVDALKWAAYTYVVAALGSLATLLYYISILAGARRND